jgi:hypothetical protein
MSQTAGRNRIAFDEDLATALKKNKSRPCVNESSQALV